MEKLPGRDLKKPIQYIQELESFGFFYYRSIWIVARDQQDTL